jgi:hypothetical protein
MERRIQGEAVGVCRYPRSNTPSRRRRTRCSVMSGLVRTTTVMPVRTTPVRTTPVETVESVGADLCLALLPVREAPHPNLTEVEDMGRDHNPNRAFSMPTVGRSQLHRCEHGDGGPRETGKQRERGRLSRRLATSDFPVRDVRCVAREVPRASDFRRWLFPRA